ncbi:unnamed protein product [Rotaria magnacalcarata]|uniref:Uncharacterized protein n=1 Tax=Rotaria magnacalcarata TaxID=392030 RepID=A0A816FQ84_9BILA|nr:unnamed protein product [Rotaria magnacalcarata]
MALIQLLIIFALFKSLDTLYSLYYSTQRPESNSTFDCWHALVVDHTADHNIVRTSSNHNLIPYCRRLDQREEKQELSMNSYRNIKRSISFAELYRTAVTSMELRDWTAPIDIAERYEINGQYSNEIFQTCSSSWFGSTCQYRLENDEVSSFRDVVDYISQRRFIMSNWDNSLKTCYSFLPGCYHEDEQFCRALEINESSNIEYRCYFGGQCIPSAFVRDGKTGTDCLDCTNEINTDIKNILPTAKCMFSSAFRCEEYKSRRFLNFPCGDGEIFNGPTPHFEHSCNNDRANKCLSIVTGEDGKLDCRDSEDEWDEYKRQFSRGNIPFGLICDGVNNLDTTHMPIETYETHCQWWPCNNVYYRCDNVWHCLNRIDELNCPGTPCALNEHKCSSPSGSSFSCVSAFNLVETYSDWTTFQFFRKIYLNNGTHKDPTKYF